MEEVMAWSMEQRVRLPESWNAKIWTVPTNGRFSVVTPLIFLHDHPMPYVLLFVRMVILVHNR